MRGVYRLSGTIASVTTAKTLLYITTDDDPPTPIEILSARITCHDEDTAEQFFASLNRVTSGTATGPAEVPKATEEGSAPFGGTCILNATGEPTYDDITDAIASGGANKLSGWEYLPMPEERPIVKANDSVGLFLGSTIASCTLTAEITFRELG